MDVPFSGKPAPTSGTPAPAGSNPAPTGSTPAPPGSKPGPASSKPAPASNKPSYTYVQLTNAAEEQGVRNVWASVVECSVPRPTKGTDMVCNMYVVDPSITVEEGEPLPPQLELLRNGVEVLMFSPDASAFPRLQNPGDFIRFHRVEVTSFHGNGKPQLIAKVGKGRPCHYCLFSCKNTGGDVPYQKSSVNYTIEDHDKHTLGVLREFYGQRGAPTAKADKYLFRIAKIQPETFVDLVCQVVAAEEGGPRQRTLYVWDGSDACPLPCWQDCREAEQTEEELHHPDESLCRRLPHLEGLQRVAEFPELGTVLPVNLHKPITRADTTKRLKFVPKWDQVDVETPMPELPAVGAWVKLRNLRAVAVDGQLQAMYQPSSKWVPWWVDPASIQELHQRRAANRVAEWAPTKDSELLAIWTSHERSRTPYTPLRTVLAEADSGSEQDYHCLVRAINHLPEAAEQFCVQRHPEAEWEFCMKLHLEDATAELDALLTGEHGSAFFRGCPAQDMSLAPPVAEILRHYVDCIEGGVSTRKGGVWMDCCVSRMYPKGAGVRDMSTAKYLITDTVLQVEL